MTMYEIGYKRNELVQETEMFITGHFNGSSYSHLRANVACINGF